MFRWHGSLTLCVILCWYYYPLFIYFIYSVLILLPIVYLLHFPAAKLEEHRRFKGVLGASSRNCWDLYLICKGVHVLEAHSFCLEFCLLPFYLCLNWKMVWNYESDFLLTVGLSVIRTESWYVSVIWTRMMKAFLFREEYSWHLDELV